jgi:hypothetical protein
MKTFKHKIKRWLQKLAIKYLKIFSLDKEFEHGEFENEGLSICKNLISKEESKLLISPISKKRYIKNDDKKIFIIFEPTRTLTIVNHLYSYTIDLHPKACERLIDIFDNEVESRRSAMEMEIKSNVKHSLSSIYKNLINEKNT